MQYLKKKKKKNKNDTYLNIVGAGMKSTMWVCVMSCESS